MGGNAERFVRALQAHMSDSESSSAEESTVRYALYVAFIDGWFID